MANTTLLGDPARLAELQFRLAQELCGNCRDYHALWPYRRLAGTVFGVEHSSEIVESLLREATPRQGHILIAGASDAGTTALVANATAGLDPEISVLDRCLTPLAICRHYARNNNFDVVLLPLDLMTSPLPRRGYDVILLHCFLRFMSREQQQLLLASLADRLSESGALIVVERQSRGIWTKPGADEGVFMLDAIAAHGLTLPEDRDAFLLRANRMQHGRDSRTSAAIAGGELMSALRERGFTTIDTVYESNAVSLASGEQRHFEIAVARRA